MVEFGTSSTFRGWVRVRVLGYSSGVRGKKVKSRDSALASDLVRAPLPTGRSDLLAPTHITSHTSLIGLGHVTPVGM